MERIHALAGLRRMLVGRLLVSPAHVQADGFDPRGPFGPELFVEAQERRRVPAFFYRLFRDFSG
jgi:hypothetical protein